MGDAAKPRRRTVADYAKPSTAGARSSITPPAPTATSWEISPLIISLIIDSVQFYGFPDEDPNKHLNQFIRICDTFRIDGLSTDACLLRLFPFSLTGKAESWLDSLPTGSITTWPDLEEKFLNKYYPLSKTSRLRRLIHSFRQDVGESFYDTWERFKDLLNKCPHHGLKKWALVEIFYEGVDYATKRMLDTAAGANLMTSRTPDECMELFEDLAINSYHYIGAWSLNSHRGVQQRDPSTALAVQVEALQKEIRDIQEIGVVKCEICRGGHATNDCPISMDNESTLKKMMEQQMTMMSQFMELQNSINRDNQVKLTEHNTMIQSQGETLQRLEKSVGQLGELMRGIIDRELPSSTEWNPEEEMQAIADHRKGLTEDNDPEMIKCGEVIDEDVISIDECYITTESSDESPEEAVDATKSTVCIELRPDVKIDAIQRVRRKGRRMKIRSRMEIYSPGASVGIDPRGWYFEPP